MNKLRSLVLVLLFLCLEVDNVYGEDPYLKFEWEVSYGTMSPLGEPQQVILINGQFPGPKINCTSNNNIIVNVMNRLDEPFLITWKGIQQRKNSWQDGVSGTNCPIPPGKNFTYRFQVKDQIGTYFYHPSTALHRSVGGYGPITIHSRLLIPVPFDPPTDDFTVFVSDWYSKTSHKTMRGVLDSGRSLRRPDGIVINGKSGGKGDREPAMFNVVAGKTYRFRFCNVGMKYSVNVRIQRHTMKLVEMEGSHTVQNLYELLDLHLGQCLSVLVTADQQPKDYFVVASSRFTKQPHVATATIRYANGKGPPSPELGQAPEGWEWSLNQFNSFRWNLTASAARPNPQGSYHYGQINITRTIRLVSTSGLVDGKLRYAINGVSHTNPETPMKLAQYYGIENKVFKYNLIKDEYTPPNQEKITIAPNVVNATFRNFVEIILENHEKTVQSWHMDGYNFFAVAIAPGRWKPEMRSKYNLLDALSRSIIQVYPNSWAAIMFTLDNPGLWNLRSNSLERQYLGHQLYISVSSPNKSSQDEYNMPDNNLLCGLIKDLPFPKPHAI